MKHEQQETVTRSLCYVTCDVRETIVRTSQRKDGGNALGMFFEVARGWRITPMFRRLRRATGHWENRVPQLACNILLCRFLDGDTVTPEEADKAYDEAPSVPIDEEEIDRLVKYATSHKWIPWRDECPECGNGENEVYTVSDAGAYDGDEVKCSECGQTGYVSADEEGCQTVWHE